MNKEQSGPSTSAEHRMQGHWLLMKMGKKVLRPGGIEMTNNILSQANPSSDDRIVEFGPGVGHTAKLLLEADPKSYTGVDAESVAAPQLQKVLDEYPQAKTVSADAAQTGLADESADLVVGEALLTMQSYEHKGEMVREAFRVLAPGGRYAIHELGLRPDEISENIKTEVQKGLSRTIKVGARPLTMAEWTQLLEENGFKVVNSWSNEMHLLEPKRFIADEGILGAAKFMSRMLANPRARKRILGMRGVFRQYAEYLCAVGLVAVKPS